MADRKRNVGIVVFDGVEVLDFAGPYEVFSVAGEVIDPGAFNVYLIAESANTIVGRNDFRVEPHHTFSDCPEPDIFLVPGGPGTRIEENRPEMVDWVSARAESAELVLSVCTGARILAKAGLLDGLEATTHWVSIDELKEMAPAATVHDNRRFVDNGKVVTSAGVSAGIDMSLHIVARLCGEKAATETAHFMEYDGYKREAA
ncbi:MAG: AraC family transcriptional regulator [Alphaproteobacteria bacterium]|nr:AraC family transcriptional regulator [Alphaproteobacteria bacterium]|tara:strand:- start:829 stop:1434 length:606 start_codon:yes stop_codon:yes gene_type:complete